MASMEVWMIILLLYHLKAGLAIQTSTRGPNFTIEPPYIVEFSNTTGTKVLCSASGYPHPQISWSFNDGNTVKDVNELRQIQADGSLMFSPFRAEDYRQDVHAAIYRCLASNTAGTVISRKVFVKAVMAQQFELEVYDSFVIKGNIAILKCHIPTFLKNYLRNFSWIKDRSTKITNDDHYTILPAGELLLKNVNFSDSGSTFQCEAQHILTREARRSISSGKLFVTEPEGNVFPKMLDISSHIIIKEGQTAILACVAQGFPTPKTSWKKIERDGEAVSLPQNVRYVQTPISLTIENSVSEDSGIYQCTATNSKGSTNSEISLTIQVPVIVKISPSKATLNSNERQELYCNVTGISNPSVMWTKNSEILNDHQNTQKLIVKDPGMYQCFVKTSEEMVQDIAEISTGDQIPMMISAFEENVFQPRETVTLKCTASGFPLPTIEWFHEIASIKNSSNVNIKSENKAHKITSVLEILQIRTQDGGVYKCQATNPLGKAESRARINVHGLLSARQSQKINAVAGGKIMIDCPYFGYPVQSIVWKKGEKRLPFDLRQRTFKNGTIILSDIKKSSDGGKYTCIVRNKDKEIKSEVDLSIVTAPKIMPFSFQEDLLREGMRARLQCVVSEGDSPITTKWTKDNHPLPSDLGITVRQLDEFSSILTINNVSPRHNGIYSCTATNDAATSTYEAKLYVNVPPKIIPFSFQDKFITSENQARLLCGLLEGDLPLEIRWLHNGISVNEVKGIISRQIDSFSNVLTIPIVTKYHSGNYTCVAENEYATVNFTAELIVNVAPKIIPFSFQADHLFEGVLARVSCVIYQGDLPITIQWFKDNQQLNNVPELSIRNIDDFSSILTINRVQRKHSGDYTCVAKNDAATVNYTATLTVNVPPKIVPFTFQDEHLLEGMLVRISCVVSRGDLPLQITWLKDGQRILPDSSITIRNFDEYSSVMSIDPVRVEHNGNYTCIAQNNAGSVSYSSALLIQEQPKWIVEPNDTSVLSGKSVTIPCLTDGYPNPSTSWLRIIDSETEERITLQTDQNYIISANGSLTILNAKSFHEGNYFCHSTNSIGNLNKMILLTVNSVPRFDNSTEEVTIRRGLNVTLRCEANGDQPMQFRWKSGDLQLHNNSGLYILTSTDKKSSSLLNIEHIEVKHSREYVCVATNQYGNNEKTFTVVVKDVPQSPKDLKIIQTGNKSILIGWTVVPDIVSPVKRFRIHYKLLASKWDNSTLTQTVNKNQNKTEIRGLQPTAAYTVRVFAENEIGISLPSQELIITMPEEAPSGPPTEINIVVIDAQTLKVSWKPPQRKNWNGKIRGYRVGFKVAKSSEPYEFKVLEVPEDYLNTLSLPLTDLQKFTEYSIVIQAFNDGGNGPSSDEVVALTSESVPTKSPQNVRCSVLNSQSIHVTWQTPPLQSIHGVLQGYKIVFIPIDDKNGYVKAQTKTVNSQLKTTFTGLEKFTNYSIQVLAFTRRGDGIKSEAIFCKTMEDIPEPPALIKVLPESSQSVLVVWKPPNHPNGKIFKYTIYVQTKNNGINKNTVNGNTTVYEVTGLSSTEQYGFWVTASTLIGESQPSPTVMQSPNDILVPAKIAAFDAILIKDLGDDVKLSCRAVGVPPPVHQWINSNEKFQILPDGSLIIKDVTDAENDNYTCEVENKYGHEKVSYALIVQSTPAVMLMEVSLITTNSIDIQWKPGYNGGSPILGYKIYFKHEDGEWRTIELDSMIDTYQLQNLQCGMKYHIYILAFNKLGDGKATALMTTATKGGVPAAPRLEKLIEEGSTYATIHLDAWIVDKCLIKYFVIEYKPVSNENWLLFSDELIPDKRKVVMSDLSPATWYNLRIIAHSSAGSTAKEYMFATLTLDGVTIDPELVADEAPSGVLAFTLDLKLIISVVVTVVAVTFVSVIVCLCVRKSQPKSKHGRTKRHRYSRSVSEDGYNDGNFAYIQGRDGSLYGTDPRRKMKKGELAPYATAHLSEFQPQEMVAFDNRNSMIGIGSTGVVPGMGMRQMDVSGMGSSDVILQDILHQYPTAPPMSVSYGGSNNYPRGFDSVPVTPKNNASRQLSVPPPPPLPLSPPEGPSIHDRRILSSNAPAAISFALPNVKGEPDQLNADSQI